VFPKVIVFKQMSFGWIFGYNIPTFLKVFKLFLGVLVLGHYCWLNTTINPLTAKVWCVFLPVDNNTTSQQSIWRLWFFRVYRLQSLWP